MPSAPDRLIFLLSNGETVEHHAGDEAPRLFEQWQKGHGDTGSKWIKISDHEIILRDAIVGVRLGRPGSVTGV